MSKLLTQDQIKELILAKEKQDAVFKHNMEVEAEKTQELFLKIKDDFLNYAIEECILGGYILSSYNIDFCTTKAINKNCDLNLENIGLLTIVEIEDVLGKVDMFLLRNNLTDLLLKNGFNLDYIGDGKFYSTSKEALLRLNEHSKDCDSYKIEPLSKYDYGENEIIWVGLILVIVLSFILL